MTDKRGNKSIKRRNKTSMLLTFILTNPLGMRVVTLLPLFQLRLEETISGIPKIDQGMKVQCRANVG